MNFKTYLENNRNSLNEQEIIFSLAFMLSEDMTLNESVSDISKKMEPHLKKVGLKVHKNSGIFD